MSPRILLPRPRTHTKTHTPASLPFLAVPPHKPCVLTAQGRDVYASQLANITLQLKAKEPQAKLLFAITSPMVCNLATDTVVVELNKQAAVAVGEAVILLTPRLRPY